MLPLIIDYCKLDESVRTFIDSLMNGLGVVRTDWWLEWSKADYKNVALVVKTETLTDRQKDSIKQTLGIKHVEMAGKENG